MFFARFKKEADALALPPALCTTCFPKVLPKCGAEESQSRVGLLCVGVFMALLSSGRDTHAAKGCTDLPPSLDCVTTDFQPAKNTWTGGVKLRLKTR